MRLQKLANVLQLATNLIRKLLQPMTVYGLKNWGTQTYTSKLNANNVTTEPTTNSTWLILLNYMYYHIKKAFNLTFQHLPLNPLDSDEKMDDTARGDGKEFTVDSCNCSANIIFTIKVPNMALYCENHS